MGIKPGSSARVTQALNHRTTSPALRGFLVAHTAHIFLQSGSWVEVLITGGKWQKDKVRNINGDEVNYHRTVVA